MYTSHFVFTFNKLAAPKHYEYKNNDLCWQYNTLLKNEIQIIIKKKNEKHIKYHTKVNKVVITMVSAWSAPFRKNDIKDQTVSF